MKAPHNLIADQLLRPSKGSVSNFSATMGYQHGTILLQLQKPSDHCARVKLRPEMDIWLGSHCGSPHRKGGPRVPFSRRQKSHSAYPRLIGMAVFDFALGFVNLHA